MAYIDERGDLGQSLNSFVLPIEIQYMHSTLRTCYKSTLLELSILILYFLSAYKVEVETWKWKVGFAITFWSNFCENYF